MPIILEVTCKFDCVKTKGNIVFVLVCDKILYITFQGTKCNNKEAAWVSQSRLSKLHKDE
jgi:hypothetical protein